MSGLANSRVLYTPVPLLQGVWEKREAQEPPKSDAKRV